MREVVTSRDEIEIDFPAFGVRLVGYEWVFVWIGAGFEEVRSRRPEPEDSQV